MRNRVGLLLFAFPVFAAGQSLLRLQPQIDRSTFKGCSQADVDSCIPAEIDLNLLQSGDTIELPDGTTLMLSRRGLNSAVFKNVSAEAVFVWDGVHVAGHISSNGESWMLEGCGDECFLWIKQTKDWLDETSVPTSNLKNGIFQTPDTDKLLKQGLEDSTTEVTYSVMIWYTPQFYAQFASEADMNLFVDLVFEETNQGYINSLMPVRATKLGPKLHPTIVDIEDSSALLGAFEDSMPQHELLNCADSAALLIHEFDNCGIAKMSATSSCRTYSVTKKSCATGYYSFGHEIGHNFGATHNQEEFDSTSGDGYAHLILPTGATQFSGYRTILGYNAFGHKNRVNYYSNPDVIFSTTGTATGVTGLSNNARLITANRFAMAACGTDEPNGACNDCSLNPTAEICLDCCEKVTLSSTNSDFLSSGYKVFAGTYSKYTANPEVNNRMVYKLDGSSTDYCLFYAVGRWAVSKCENVGAGNYYVKSANTPKKCVNGVTDWQYSSNPDTTMNMVCTDSCASDPPSAPAGSTSDWDQTTRNIGTIVTYSCTSTSVSMATVCAFSPLSPTNKWNPLTIPSDLCSDTSNPTTTSTTTSVTTHTTTSSTTTSPNTNLQCEDQGCAESFQGDGECVDTKKIDWTSLASDYDLQAGVKEDKCTTDCNCFCFKKKMCPVVSKTCLKKKGQCVSPSSAPPQGWYYAGFLCDKKSKCKCYQECKNTACAKKKGICLIPSSDTIPAGYKKKGVCNKKAKCNCYVPICSPNAACTKKGGECYGKGMEVPKGAKYLGWCSKSQKCKCYKAPEFTCSETQITIPATFNANGKTEFCIDKMNIILMRDGDGRVEGYAADGGCGFGIMEHSPEYRQGGGLAYVGKRLISFGGWKSGHGHPDTFEYSVGTNTWASIDDMASMTHTSYYSYTKTTVGFDTNGQEVAYYFASPELQTFNPTTAAPWSLQQTGIDLWTMGVVAVGNYVIIIDGKTGNVWKYNPSSNTNQQLPSMPVTENQCYYPTAAILERASGVGIMVVCTNGETFFCLLDRLEWVTPSGWTSLAVVDPTTTSGTMLAYVEGTMHCLRGKNAWKWDDASETWRAAPGGFSAYAQNYGRTTYTSIPKNLIPGCSTTTSPGKG